MPRSRAIKDLFFEAADIAPNERAAFLDRVCADDSQLRAQIEELLASQQSVADGFMAQPAAAAPNKSATQTNILADEVPARGARDGIGARIDAYQLVHLLGEGGMGSVFLARQTEPVKRDVALKVVREGIVTPRVLARFEAERQALAMMDHPNIAKVFDGGTTSAGQPYIVMELIEGLPITKYCDDGSLPVSERLKLFISACRAIQHAHQKGIIHRDIKPSNILVATVDGKPMVKVIDFGIAKATGAPLTDNSFVTHAGAIIGTLEYMSPEQAEMTPQGVDVRSDIYSLGVLLYELMTGTTPLNRRWLGEMAFMELLRVIREVEPPKPSTRIAESKKVLGRAAAMRRSDPERLARQVRGELDWIAMRALEKDRTRRYESANGLARDIERYLTDEPVEACPPSRWYYTRKMVRRNKGLFAAAAAIFLALGVGAAVSLWQAVRATRAEQDSTRVLDELRATAPAFAEQAHALAGSEHFSEALEKLDYAIKLRPDEPGYRVARGDLLQCQLRLADAASAYADALRLRPRDARILERAALCRQILGSNPADDGTLSRESLSALYAGMQREHCSAAELMPVARLLGDEKKQLVDYWLGRLKDVHASPEFPLEKRLVMNDDGGLEFDLSATAVSDLSALAGMPLAKLSLADCPDVRDIAALHGMPLQSLDLSKTAVRDISPLTGMATLTRLNLDFTPAADLAPLARVPLRELSLRSTKVRDLAPLAKMPLAVLQLNAIPAADFTPLEKLPLETLNLESTGVRDLVFLREIPLKKLSLQACNNARQFFALRSIKSLETLILPDIFRDIPANEINAIASLKSHPALRQIDCDLENPVKLGSAASKAEFWRKWDLKEAAAKPLRAAGWNPKISLRDDGKLSVDLENQPVTDLSPLKDAPICYLNLTNTRVTDLKPLQGMRLECLFLGDTKVADLTPLIGMPLRELSVEHTPVVDLAPLKALPLQSLSVMLCPLLRNIDPLKDMKTLERLILTICAEHIEFLRDMPNLKRLSYSGNRITGPVCSAEKFWSTFDNSYWAQRVFLAEKRFTGLQDENGFWSVSLPGPGACDCALFKDAHVKALILTGAKLINEQALGEMPLEFLGLSQSEITDLSFLKAPVLRGALKRLDLSRLKHVDFSPVAGCSNLEELNVADTEFADLSLLRGTKLRILRAGNSKVADLSALTALPLETLNLEGTPVRDISPLLQCRSLRELVLPAGAREIAALKGLTALAAISYHDTIPVQAARDFWDELEHEKWMGALRDAGIKIRQQVRQPDGTWWVFLNDQPLSDLSLLKGARISNLFIQNAPVSDLNPLRGMPMKFLSLEGTRVTDLTPLGQMPLESIRLDNTPVADLAQLRRMHLHAIQMKNCKRIEDVSPLAEIESLEKIILPRNAKGIERLRTLPRLIRIGYDYDKSGDVNQSALEFWAEFDRAQAAAETKK